MSRIQRRRRPRRSVLQWKCQSAKVSEYNLHKVELPALQLQFYYSAAALLIRGIFVFRPQPDRDDRSVCGIELPPQADHFRFASAPSQL